MTYMELAQLHQRYRWTEPPLCMVAIATGATLHDTVPRPILELALAQMDANVRKCWLDAANAEAIMDGLRGALSAERPQIPEGTSSPQPDPAGVTWTATKGDADA